MEMFPLIIFIIINHIAFIFQVLIGLDKDMTPNNIEFIRSEVKVKMIAFVRKFSTQ